MYACMYLGNGVRRNASGNPQIDRFKVVRSPTT